MTLFLFRKPVLDPHRGHVVVLVVVFDQLQLVRVGLRIFRVLLVQVHRRSRVHAVVAPVEPKVPCHVLDAVRVSRERESFGGYLAEIEPRALFQQVVRVYAVLLHHLLQVLPFVVAPMVYGVVVLPVHETDEFLQHAVLAPVFGYERMVSFAAAFPDQYADHVVAQIGIHVLVGTLQIQEYLGRAVWQVYFVVFPDAFACNYGAGRTLRNSPPSPLLSRVSVQGPEHLRQLRRRPS